MLRSTRAALAVGLGCVGVAGLVGQSAAQQGDSKAQRFAATNANAGTGAAAVSVQMPPVSIGSVDVEGVFKSYDKVKVAGEILNAEVMKRYKELTDLANEGKQEQEKLAHMAPGTPDAKKCEDRMVQLKAQIEAGRQNAEREFTQKETETMSSIYNEVAAMVALIAKDRGMTFVVKYNDAKVMATEPNSAMSAMSKTIVYADPRVDITNDTIRFLNYNYKIAGGVPPKNPNAATPVARPAAKPGAAAPVGR